MLTTQYSPLGAALGAEAGGVEGGEGEAGAGGGVSMAGVVPRADVWLNGVLAQHMQLLLM